jgi:hypothetical protein
MAVATILEDDLKIFSRMLGMIAVSPVAASAAMHVLIVEGLPGDEPYADQFDQQVASIQAAAESVTDGDHIVILRSADTSRETVLDRLATLSEHVSSEDQVAIFMIGHGSYDEYEYKFNIAGPDLTGADLSEALQNIESASVIVINTSSASGATAELLAGENRIIVLATRSGAERHATRFGTYFAAALSDNAADTNKNELVSVREAFDYAARQVGDYFERSGQLATEHPVLDGERADRIALARLGAARPAVVDPMLDELMAERDGISEQIESLRLARDDMDPSDYQSELLQKMLDLARIEEAIERREQELATND